MKIISSTHNRLHCPIEGPGDEESVVNDNKFVMHQVSV